MIEIELKLKKENEMIKELFNFNGCKEQLTKIKELFTNNIKNSKNEEYYQSPCPATYLYRLLFSEEVSDNQKYKHPADRGDDENVQKFGKFEEHYARIIYLMILIR